MKPIDNLLKDKKIIEKRKVYFTIWVGILVLGFAIAIVFAVINGKPFNYSTEYTGGYSISVRLGTKLTNSTADSYTKDITNIIQNTKKDGKSAKVVSTQRYGEDSTAGIRFKYNAVGDDSFMNELGDSIVESINAQYFANDEYVGQATNNGFGSPTIKSDTIFTTVMASLLALVLIVVYVSFRFNFISGLASVLVALIDLGVMFAFASITRLEIGSTFIIALIAGLVYSINNSLVVFDRVRENMRNKDNGTLSSSEIANISIKNSLSRSFMAFVGITIISALVAVIAVPGVRLFVLPLFVGIVSSSFSSMLVATSLFAMVGNRHPDLMQKHAFAKSIGAVFSSRIEKHKQKKENKKKNKVVSKNKRIRN